MNESNCKMLACETRAINAITTYMVRRFDARIKYKYQKSGLKADELNPRLTGVMQQFWTECQKTFEDYINTLTLESTGADNKSTFDLPFDGKVNASRGISGKVSWIDPLEELKRAYSDVEKLYLRGSTEHKKISSDFKVLYKNIKQVSQLPRVEMFPRLSLSDILEMLDLRNEDVQATLPYLLTSYVYNFRKERLFYQGTKLRESVFNGTDVTASDAPEIRNRIKQLARIFSLSGNIYDLVCFQSNRPSVTIYPLDKAGHRLSKVKLGKQYVKFESVLRDVFREWCAIIPKCAEQVKFTELEQNLDLSTCQYLLDYYISQEASRR